MIDESQEEILQRVEALEQKAAVIDDNSDNSIEYKSQSSSVSFKKIRNEEELREFAKTMKNRARKTALVRIFLENTEKIP